MAAVFMCVAMVDDVLISVITLLNSDDNAVCPRSVDSIQLEIHLAREIYCKEL